MSKTRQTKTGGRAAIEGHIPGQYALAVGMPDAPAPEGWEWRKLTDVARLESGHTPTRKKPEYWDGDIPWIGIRDATENHGKTLNDTKQHTNELGIANSSARLLPANTVCLSRTASVGYVVVMGRTMATSQDFVNWICGEELDHRFLKYVLLAEKESFLSFASGTTHQTIYFPEVKAFHICMPSLETQRRIAGILSAYDDLIENDLRRIRILEEMAQSLYREWFVHFRIPSEVLQKAGLPPEITLVDSPLGPIPEGWEVKKMGEVAKIVMGLSPKGHTYNDTGEGTPLVNGPVEFSERFTKRVKWTTAPNKVCKPGDLIVCVRGSTTGKNVKSDGEYCLGRGVCSMSSEYQAFVDQMFAEQLPALLGMTSGSTFPSWTGPLLQSHPVVSPPDPVLAEFDKLARPMSDSIQTLARKNQTLRQTRDLLLPKLLSPTS